MKKGKVSRDQKNQELGRLKHLIELKMGTKDGKDESKK